MNRLISSMPVAALLAAQLFATPAAAQDCPAPGESGIIGVFEGDSVGAGVAYLQVQPAPTATFTIPDCGFTAVFVEARWDAFADDVDLYLLDEDGAELGNSQAIQAGQAANIQGTELVVLSQPDAGIYNAELRGWTSTGASSYTITVMGTVPGGGGGGGDLSTDAGRDDVVVIAVVDSGINPYHWDYLASKMPQHKDGNAQNDLPLSDDPATWLPGHPGANAFASYTKLELQLEEEDSSASSSELHDDDIAQWSKIQYSEGTLNDQVHMYWFPGTKIVGHVAFPGALVGDPATSAVIGQSSGNIDTWAYDSHGIGTSTVAVGNIHGSCPECVLVYVHGTSEEANQWVAKQDWIDLQSNSWGLSLTGAARDRIYAGSDTELQRRATERGQPHFFSAGNGLENAFVTPNPTLFSSQEGPDWIVTVGAIETDGSSPGHGRPSDISSIGGGYPSGNGSEGTDGSIIDDSVTATSGFGGTSNATPVVAGMYGEALHKLRRALPGASRVQSGGVIATGDASCGSANDQCALADGVLTVHELLEALYRGAEYTGTGHNVGGLATIPASGNAQELQYMAMGHGAYFGKMLGPQQYEVEVAKIVGYALGQWTETPSAEDAAWYVADSICRQAIWGPWAHGYATDSSSVDADPQWPVRSFLAQGCPEVLPTVVEAEKLYASQFRELDSSANDTDDDGVENSADNCPDTANADQKDSDGDGEGDACESGPSNTAPEATAQSVTTDYETAIEITLAGTDADGDNLSYAIVAAPANGTLSAVNGDKVTYTPNAGYEGADSFSFRANDGTEDSAPATVSITVNEDGNTGGGDNGTLDAELTVTAGADNFTFVFDASASHYEEGGTLNQPMYRFAFGDGETTPPQSAATISHSYDAAGTYRAFVVVSDANGNSAISEEQLVEVIITIEVTDGGENAARMTVDRATGAAPLRVTFDATGSTTAEGFSISNYAWDFDGDGTVDLSGSNGRVQHVYTVAGNYQPEVTVTFTDDADAQNTETSVAKASVAATNNATPVSDTKQAGGGALGTLLLLPLLGFAALRRKRLH